MTTDKQSFTGEPSFCLPRATIDALLEAQATTHEICIMFTLARATDKTGCYSRASVHSVNEANGANKDKIKSCLARLTQIRATRKVVVIRDGIEAIETEDLGPILWAREDWLSRFGGPIPDDLGHPTFYVLPSFGEPHFDRVWFSSNLVGGYGAFKRPLKVLRDLGDYAARLLLVIYAQSDMQSWGGACPVGKMSAPWQPYKTAKFSDVDSTISFSKASKSGGWRTEALDPRVDRTGESLTFSIAGLISSGLVYEVVTVINRQLIDATYDERSSDRRPEIDPDSQPLYELHTCTSNGNPPVGEEGLARSTAEIALALGHPLWNKNGQFDHTYGVLSLIGQPIAVIGVLRPRFRVRNHRNAGVTDAWNRIRQSQADAMDMVQRVRATLNLDPVPSAQANPVGESSSLVEPVAHVPINNCQYPINPDQSLKREKRKRSKPRKSFEADWERDLRNAV